MYSPSPVGRAATGSPPWKMKGHVPDCCAHIAVGPDSSTGSYEVVHLTLPPGDTRHVPAAKNPTAALSARVSVAAPELPNPSGGTVRSNEAVEDQACGADWFCRPRHLRVTLELFRGEYPGCDVHPCSAGQPPVRARSVARRDEGEDAGRDERPPDGHAEGSPHDRDVVKTDSRIRAG
jgi:hypothetical protein